MFQNTTKNVIHDSIHRRRLLITGATGFLGWNLVSKLQSLGYHVTGCYHEHPPLPDLCDSWVQLDLSDPGSLSVLRQVSLDCIVHCASISNVQKCELQRELAFRINVSGTECLVDIANAANIPIIYISTDLVFDGTKGWYKEDDPVSPITYYGETKCLAEDIVQRHTGAYFILRTALMYGMDLSGYGSFLKWTIGALKAGQEIELYTNQFRTPLYALDVADIIHGMLTRIPSPGIYHAGGPDRLSRYEIGKQAAEFLRGSSAGIKAAILKRDSGLAHYDDTSLATAKIRSALDMRFTSLTNGLLELNQQHLS